MPTQTLEPIEKFVSEAAYDAAQPAPVVIPEPVAPADKTPGFVSAGTMSVGDRLGRRLEDGSYETALGHKATPGHHHVANVWGSKQPNLTDFIATIQADGETKQDILVPIKNLVVSPELHVTGTGKYTGLEGDALPVNTKLEPGALRNLVMRMYAENAKSEEASGDTIYGAASCFNMNTAKWLIDHGHTPELAGYINEGLQESLEYTKRDSTEKAVLLRTRRNGDGDYTADGVLSQRYGIIDNDEVLQVIADNFPTEHRGGLLASHAAYDGRNLNLNILVPDMCKERPDSEYGVGIAVKNSETGNFTLNISAFLFRAICLNGCIWDKKTSDIKVNKKHLGVIDWETLKADIQKVIMFGLTEGNLLLGQFDLAHQIVVPNPMQTIAFLGKQNKLTTTETRAWYADFQAGQYEDTAFGVINGLTQAAQQFQGVIRRDLEATAARILTHSLEADINAIGARWEKYQNATADAWVNDTKSMRQYVGVTI